MHAGEGDSEESGRAGGRLLCPMTFAHVQPDRGQGGGLSLNPAAAHLEEAADAAQDCQIWVQGSCYQGCEPQTLQLRTWRKRQLRPRTSVRG